MQTFFFLSFLELAGMPPHGMMPPPGFPGMHAVPGMPPPPGQISDPQPPPPPPPGGQMMPPPQPMGGQFPPVPPHMPPPQVHKQYTYLLILLKVQIKQELNKWFPIDQELRKVSLSFYFFFFWQS